MVHTLKDETVVQVKLIGDRTVRLCSNGNCCPEIANDGEYVSIKDDFGGSVKIKRSEALAAFNSQLIKEIGI